MTYARSARMLVFSCLFVFAAMPTFPQTAQDSGARQFAVSCAGCHGLDGSGSVKGTAIATLPSAIARSDDDLSRIIRDGIPGKGMPASKQLGDEKVQALVRFLRTLQSTNEVAPATNLAAPKTADHVNATSSTPGKTVEPPSGGISNIDVQQSQLNQK